MEEFTIKILVGLIISIHVILTIPLGVALFVYTLVKLRAEEIDPMGIGTIMAKILAQRRKSSE